MARIVRLSAAMILFLAICSGCEKAASPAITPIPIVIPVPTENAPEGEHENSADGSAVRIAAEDVKALTPPTPGAQDAQSALAVLGAADLNVSDLNILRHR